MTEGPDSKYIILVSSDNHTFYVKRKVVTNSGTLKAMLQGPAPYAEMDDNRITLKCISSKVLSKVIDYFIYKDKYTNVTHEIPEFPMDSAMSLEVLAAANFLDC